MRRLALPAACQYFAHLVIGCLFKLLIPLADAVERLRHGRADHFIYFSLKTHQRVRWRNGHGHDDAAGMLLAHRLGRCTHGRACCQAIIDENHAMVFDDRLRLITAIHALPPLQFSTLLARHGVDGLFTDVQALNDRVVQNARASCRDRTHREFFSAGHAKFAHHQHIQGRIQLFSNRFSSHDTPSRQGEHQNIITSHVSVPIHRPPPGRRRHDLGMAILVQPSPKNLLANIDAAVGLRRTHPAQVLVAWLDKPMSLWMAGCSCRSPFGRLISSL